MIVYIIPPCKGLCPVLSCYIAHDFHFFQEKDRAYKAAADAGGGLFQLELLHPAGVYPAYPDGGQDDVHTQRAGAMFYARLTAEALKAQGLV